MSAGLFTSVHEAVMLTGTDQYIGPYQEMQYLCIQGVRFGFPYARSVVVLDDVVLGDGRDESRRYGPGITEK